MCLVLLAIGQSAALPFILAVNRDEFFARPTKGAHWWEDNQNIFGGKDLWRGGTWLGISRQGDIAFVTNVRSGAVGAASRSRGALVADYLRAPSDPRGFIEDLRSESDHYLGFNFVAGKIPGPLFHFSTLSKEVRMLDQGTFGISNADLDTPWPKVRRGKRMLSEFLDSAPLRSETLFSLLTDSEEAKDVDLPQTGIPRELERGLSPICINLAEQDYGTRSSTIITLNSSGLIHVEERSRNGVSQPFSQIVREHWPCSGALSECKARDVLS